MRSRRSTRIANFVNYLKNFTLFLSILTLILAFRLFWLRKCIGRKILAEFVSDIQTHINNFLCILFMN